jgi:hypothetical protein
MSIQTQITRIQGLVTRLITKLRNLGFLDNQSHDFYDAVQACHNLGANLETKNMVLGEDTPTPQVTTSSGYSAMSELSFTVNGNVVNPSYIVDGNTILGVSGSAIINNLKMRRASFIINASETNTVELNLIKTTQGGTYWGSQGASDLTVFPVFNELMMFKRSGGFSSKKRTCLTLFHNIINGYGEWTSVNSNAEFQHIGDALHQNLVTYTYSSDAKKLTVHLASQLDVFNGNYVLYIYY